MAHVNCLVLTFNCGREPVKPEIFAQHISQALDAGPTHDIIVLSLQEICPMPYGFIGGRCMSHYYQKLNEAVHIATGEGHYTNVFTRNLGITATMIFVHREQKNSIGSIESASTGVGWHEMGNKGAVGVKLSWLAATGKYVDFTFIAAHLAPHEVALDRRNQDWMHIVQRLVFEPVWISNKRLEALHEEEGNDRSTQTTADSDERQPLLDENNDVARSGKDRITRLSTTYSPMSYTFVAGDLNYRTSGNPPSTDDYAKYPKFSDSSDVIDDLFLKDQLRAELKAGKTLQGFHEADVHFPPTYKYTSKKQKEVGEKEQDGTLTKYIHDSSTELGYAAHRWPSWCDRVLYLAPLVEPEAKTAEVKNNFYRSLPLMSTSDHQAVVASFSVPCDRAVSIEDKRIANMDDYRVRSPYPIDPQWRERFTTARRRELALGVAAYLGLTWEGNSILLATLVGAVGGYAISKGGLF